MVAVNNKLNMREKEDVICAKNSMTIVSVIRSSNKNRHKGELICSNHFQKVTTLFERLKLNKNQRGIAKHSKDQEENLDSLLKTNSEGRYGEMKINRILQFITNIHRIHHITFSYGYTFKPLGIGFFKGFGFKPIIRSEYHDCTSTGIY